MLLRPEKVRRRRRIGGGEPGGPRAPAGLSSSARGGLWRHGHARCRLPVAQSGGGGAPTTDGQGEHEHEMQEVKAKLLLVLTRSGEAWSSGNAVTAELGGGVHGGRVLARPEHERERARRDGEGWGSSGARLKEQRRDREAGHAAAAGARCSCMAATHRPRGVLWGISANTWRATEWPAWRAGWARSGPI